MSATIKSFFGTEENQATIRKFSLHLQSTPPLEPPAPNVVPQLVTFFRVFINNVSAFDQHCAFNIEWIGEHFITQLREFTEVSPEKRDVTLLSIFALIFRLICEFEFSQERELSFELASIKKFVDDNLESFEGYDRSQLIYACYIMPANITKKLINSPALAQFKTFAETAKAATELKVEWDKELEKKNAEILALRDGLNRIKTAYNFVGLVQGFEDLATVKKRERRNSFISTLMLSLVMLAPLLLELRFVVDNIETINAHRDALIYSLPALIALEIFLLYFFRIVLGNYRNVSSQLLQIDLRVALCKFIQSYVDYAVDIKKQDAQALGKFENLIFSAIVSESGSIPSTFDGIDQIAKAVGSLRGK